MFTINDWTRRKQRRVTKTQNLLNIPRRLSILLLTRILMPHTHNVKVIRLLLKMSIQNKLLNDSQDTPLPAQYVRLKADQTPKEFTIAIIWSFLFKNITQKELKVIKINNLIMPRASIEASSTPQVDALSKLSRLLEFCSAVYYAKLSKTFLPSKLEPIRPLHRKSD